MENDTSRITQNPKQASGRPCIRGMKIRATDVLKLLGKGLSFEAIIDRLPGLEKEDIVAAIAYAAEKIDHPLNTQDLDINQSWQGWWVYEEVEHWVSDRQKNLTENSKCLVWTNLILIKAKNREQAYKKAMKSSENYPIKSNGGEWRFSGIMWLGPVQDLMQEGAELVWTDRGKLRIKDIAKLVKSKDQLDVFNDKKTPPKSNPALFI